MTLLNLGCGKNIIENYINIDKYDNKGIDITLDLEIIPYPFKDNSIRHILMSHILEHLTNPYDVILECHRILSKDGTLEIRVPHFKYYNASLSLPHKHFFNENSLHCFLENDRSLQSNKMFSLMYCNVHKLFPILNRFTGLFNNSFFGWKSEIHWVLRKL